MTDDTIRIEEEELHRAERTSRKWTEEVTVAGGDLMDTLGKLLKEATVRKITVRSESGRKLFEIPLALGALGVLIIGPWTAAALVAAWLAKVSILIEREAPVSEMRTSDAAAEVIEQIPAEAEKAAKKTRKSTKKAAEAVDEAVADAIKIDEA